MKRNLILSLGFICLLTSSWSQNKDEITLEYGQKIKGRIVKFGLYRTSVVQADSLGNKQALEVPYYRIKTIDSLAYDLKGRTYEEIQHNSTKNKSFSLGLHLNSRVDYTLSDHQILGFDLQKGFKNSEYLSLFFAIGLGTTSPPTDTLAPLPIYYNYDKNSYYTGGYSSQMHSYVQTSTRSTMDFGLKLYAIPAHYWLRPYGLFQVGINSFQRYQSKIIDREEINSDGNRHYKSELSTTIHKNVKMTYGFGLGFEVNIGESFSFNTHYSFVLLSLKQTPIYYHSRYDVDNNLIGQKTKFQERDSQLSLIQFGFKYRLNGRKLTLPRRR